MLDKLLCYLEFSDKLVANLEESECLNMQTKEDIKTMSMKAQGLMEGFMNNLVAGKDKLSLLILKLEGLEASTTRRKTRIFNWPLQLNFSCKQHL